MQDFKNHEQLLQVAYLSINVSDYIPQFIPLYLCRKLKKIVENDAQKIISLHCETSKYHFINRLMCLKYFTNIAITEHIYLQKKEDRKTRSRV